MRSRILSSLSVSLLVVAVPAAAETFRVGFVADGEWTRNDEVRALLETEITELTAGEFDVQFPDERALVADWTREGIAAAIDELLSADDVDLVIALGVIASDELARRRSLPKPAISPFVIDGELQGLPFDAGASGVANLSYLTYPDGFETDLRDFREIATFRTLGVLVPAPLPAAMPELAGNTEQVAREAGVDVRIIPVGADADAALAAIGADVEAVWLAPLFQLSAAAFQTLVQGLTSRGLPSFSLLGETEVRAGVLASTNRDAFPRVARRVAINTQRILLGDDPGTFSVALDATPQWFVNMSTAAKLGAYPSWSLLTEAILVDDPDAPPKPELDLSRAVREALDANRDLAAFKESVASARSRAAEARAGLLPRVDLSARGLVVDEDRAAASFGSQAERTISGHASLRQVIFADDAWTGFVTSRHGARARAEGLETLRQDVIQEAAARYLDLLRALALERIQRDNVALTRSNLALARVRESIGISGRTDVLRWESQIASNRRDAIAASARRNVAEIALNRVRNRPLEESFRPADVDLQRPTVLDAFSPMTDRMGNKLSFRELRESLVALGLGASSEVSALDASRAARASALARSRRAWWLPSLALFGSLDHRIDESGVGAGAGSAIPGAPQADETDWSVGLEASFPLFEGGAKRARVRRDRAELNQLEREREAVVERIEQRIRSSLHLAGGSLAGIEQSRVAADAADETLELVTDAYGRGTVSILDLLDAQNAALVAREGAANAIYDFLLDLVEVQRAVGHLDVFVSEQALADYFRKMESMP